MHKSSLLCNPGELTSFFQFHILLLYLKTDENSVAEYLVKTFVSVTEAPWPCSLVQVRWLASSTPDIYSPNSQPQAQGLCLSSPLPGACELRGLLGHVDGISCGAGQVDGATRPEPAPSERRAALTHFLADWLTFPRATGHIFLWELARSLNVKDEFKCQF